MTLAELLASIQAGQAAGLGETGARLSITAEEERRDIQKATKELRERFRKAGEQAERREKRRGVGRLLGGTAGFLLGGAGGRAIGSALGQQLAAGGDRIGRVSSGLGGGMFFQGAREDVESSQRDINRFISDANRGFTSKVLTSAVTDYLGGKRMESIGLTRDALSSIPSFARSTDPEGNVLGLLEGAKAAFKAEGAKTGNTGFIDFLNTFSSPKTQSSSLLDFLPKGLDYSYGYRGIGSAFGDMGDLSNYGVTVTGTRG